MKELRNEVYSEDSQLRQSLGVHKSDLVHYIQHTIGLSENKAKSIIKKTFEWIMLNLALSKKVYIKEFGIFSQKSTETRATISFTPDKRLKNIAIEAKLLLNTQEGVEEEGEEEEEEEEEDNILTPEQEYIKRLFKELKENSVYKPTHTFQQHRHNLEAHEVRNSMIIYLKEDFPYGRDWIHPVTYNRFSCSSIKSALLILQELNPEKYRVLWALWTTRKDSIYLANKFYCSVQTIKRQWERAVDLLVLFLFFPELNSDITNVTKIQ
jgi:nucleoid DNA-binding protein